MSTPTLHRLLMLTALAAICVLIGCDTAGEDAGSVGASAVLDPDNPELTADQVLLNVDRVLAWHAELGWVELSDTEQQVDLLVVSNDLFGGLNLVDVPDGLIRRVYLRVSSATLVLSDSTEATINVANGYDIRCARRGPRGWRLIHRILRRMPHRVREMMHHRWCNFIDRGQVRIMGDIHVSGGGADVQVAFNAPRDLTKIEDGSFNLADPLRIANSTPLGPDGESLVGNAQADVNGDGVGDLVLFGYNCDGGVASLLEYHNDEGALPNDPTYEANVDGGKVTTAIHIGDVNADSHTDIAVAQGDDGVHVHTGSADGFSGTPFQSFGGAAADLASGDLNGDGLNDLVIGSTNSVNVHFGSADGGFNADADVTLGMPGGIADGDRFGRTVGLSDVNGDGHDDLFVGAYCANGGAGAAFLYYGSADGPATTPDASLANGQLFAKGGFAGEDFNGDGIGDIAIGAPGRHPAVYVYHGSADGLGAAAATTLEGSRCSGFGHSVSSTRDFDGDGVADLVVSQTRTFWGRSSSFVYRGGLAGVEADAHATLTNPPSNCALRARGLGDLNGDGATDVALCGVQHRSAAVWVYYGGLSGTRMHADRVFEGTTPGGARVQGMDAVAYNPTARGYTAPEPEPGPVSARQFAVEFHGGIDSRHLMSTAAPNVTISTGISWCGWVHLDHNRWRQTIAAQYSRAFGGWLFQCGGGRLVMTGGPDVVSTLEVQANVWTFVAFAWDGNTITFTVGERGGSLMHETVPMVGSPSVAQSEYLLGGQTHNRLAEMDGRLAEAAYWDRLVSASELDELFNNGDGRAYTGLSAGLLNGLVCYHGCQDAGIPVIDEHTGGIDMVEHITGGLVTYQSEGPGAVAPE